LFVGFFVRWFAGLTRQGPVPRPGTHTRDRVVRRWFVSLCLWLLCLSVCLCVRLLVSFASFFGGFCVSCVVALFLWRACFFVCLFVCSCVCLEFV
jgi:hypothetical protein